MIWLRIGGALRYMTAFVNGKFVSQQDGFTTPFSLDISGAANVGTENVIALRIANTFDPNPTMRLDAHDTNDPTGCLNLIANRGGLYRTVELEATNRTWIEDAYIVPDIAEELARFKVRTRTRVSAATHPSRVRVWIADANGVLRYQAMKDGATPPGRDSEAEAVVPMPGARLWSPEDPYTYMARIALPCRDQACDEMELR